MKPEEEIRAKIAHFEGLMKTEQNISDRGKYLRIGAIAWLRWVIEDDGDEKTDELMRSIE